MKKLTTLIACLALLTAFAQSQMKWGHDLTAAQKTAKASKKLIFVDFYADW